MQFAAISMSTDPESRDRYGPYLPNVGCRCPTTGQTLRYGHSSDLKTVLEAHGSKTAAFLVEPIQGEAGIVVPPAEYLREVKELCQKHNVLLICDEIQTGIGRTGKLLCSEWSGIKPDLVLLGKAISGGMYPVSCVLGPKRVMLTVEPGTHGSTYGGNPLGCAVAIRALELIEEEKMTERAQELGEAFRRRLEEMKSPIIQTVRGRGLLNAIVIDESKTGGHLAWDLCMLFKEKGLLVSQARFIESCIRQNQLTITISRRNRPIRTSSDWLLRSSSREKRSTRLWRSSRARWRSYLAYEVKQKTPSFRHPRRT